MSFKEYLKEQFVNLRHSAKNMSLVGKLFWQSGFTTFLGISVAIYFPLLKFVGLIIYIFGIIELFFVLFIVDDYFRWKKRKKRNEET